MSLYQYLKNKTQRTILVRKNKFDPTALQLKYAM